MNTCIRWQLVIGASDSVCIVVCGIEILVGACARMEEYLLPIVALEARKSIYQMMTVTIIIFTLSSYSV